MTTMPTEKNKTKGKNNLGTLTGQVWVLCKNQDKKGGVIL